VSFTNPHVLILSVAALVAAVAFLLREMRARKPTPLQSNDTADDFRPDQLDASNYEAGFEDGWAAAMVRAKNVYAKTRPKSRVSGPASGSGP
jgi:hypothetical protein